MMVADLLRHREANQNVGAPLILRADVPRLREIAHIRMKLTRTTYRLYKDMVPQQDEENINLIWLHMKNCMKHYHALLPQLYLIATQWGVHVEDNLSQDDVGSLKSEGERQRRKNSLDVQLRTQVRDTRKSHLENPGPGTSAALARIKGKGKSSLSNDLEQLERVTNQAREEVKKRRMTEKTLSKAEEDIILLKKQLKGVSPSLSLAKQDSPRPHLSDPARQSGSSEEPSTLSRGPDVRDSPASNMMESVASSDVGLQLLQVLRDAPPNSSNYSGRDSKLNEEYPDRHTQRTVYRSLVEPWSIILPEQGAVKEYNKVENANKDRFMGDRLPYPVWRRRFIATVHAQRMLISDKALALSTPFDSKNETLGPLIRSLHYDPPTYVKLISELERLFGGADQEIAYTANELYKGQKVQLTLLESVRAFRVKLSAYGTTLETYGEREAELSPNSQLYREIKDRKFTILDMIKFHEGRSDEDWEDSAEVILSWLNYHQSILEESQASTKVLPKFPEDLLNTAFLDTDRHSINCMSNKAAAAHQVALDEEYVFLVEEDTPQRVIHHMLQISQQSERNHVKVTPCDWRDMAACSGDREKLDHMLKAGS
jgi:hypothetical protein